MEEALDFPDAGLRMLGADACARYFACEFVQSERDPQPLFAGHRAIHRNLRLQSIGWCHG